MTTKTLAQIFGELETLPDTKTRLAVLETYVNEAREALHVAKFHAEVLEAAFADELKAEVKAAH